MCELSRKSAGIDCIRKHCAEYIARRDGIETDYNNIIISNGASEGIRVRSKMIQKYLLFVLNLWT